MSGEDFLYCKRCGAELDQGMDFCPKCGTKRGSSGQVYRKVAEVDWGSREVAAIVLGGALILVGLMPFFMMDTSVTGVTGVVRLALSAGIMGVVFGVGIILFGAVVPKVRTILG
jgi:hypothetical protein